MTQFELAQMLDVTLVRNNNTIKEIDDLIKNAKQYDFACVFTLQCYLQHVHDALLNDTTHAGGVIGFPSGGELTEVKLFETHSNIASGADELDMVINIGWLLSRNYDAVLDEIKRIKDIAQEKPLKCIIEISCLDEYFAKKACELVLKSGADYVKTGTGWFGPATIEQIKLIKSVVGSDIYIKAAGGIRDLETVERFKAEGVHRMGISLKSAIDIMSQVN
ncbi:MAG: deoxyribose-phosphate aldolase [Eubacteriales bacterium]